MDGVGAGGGGMDGVGVGRFILSPESPFHLRIPSENAEIRANLPNFRGKTGMFASSG